MKGAVLLVTLPLMFVIGLWLDGRLFPFTPGEPLVALAAVANVGAGLPYTTYRIRFAKVGRAAFLGRMSPKTCRAHHAEVCGIRAHP